jgi:predicted SAM-dependent methyltransferase
MVSVARARNVRFANATGRIPCADDSAAAVYGSYMIEHLDRAEARAFLGEVRRILRPGGVLRIAAPDLARLGARVSGRWRRGPLRHRPVHGPEPAGLEQLAVQFRDLVGSAEYVIAPVHGADSQVSCRWPR